MTALEYLVRAIFGLYPRPVSRCEFVNLTCDNAALASALEQKERARVRAVEKIQRLQRELNDARRAITTDLAEPELYRVCYIEGQGFGYMDPAGWAHVPDWARARVQVLAVCPSEAIAQGIAKTLRVEWQGGDTYYNLLTGENLWTLDK